MEDNTTGMEQQQQESELKPVLNADQILHQMARLFAAMETKYTITAANVRGALTTMLHNLDK